MNTSVSSQNRPRTRPLWLTLLGLACLVGLGVGAYLALVVSPPDVNQGELIRIMYAHVSVAWICFVAVAVAGLWSALYLWRGRERDDVRAVANAEAALVYSALTITGGMIYSKPTLNTFWTWDAKLTLTAIMVALIVGYFIVRALIDEPVRRGRISAVIMLIVVVSLPFNYLAAEWFRTLHPAKSVNLDGSGVTMDPSMLRVLLVNVAVAGLIYLYFVSERVRIGLFSVAPRAADDKQPVSTEVVRVG
ncbi:MAG TPA: cytochrome c biogenesis protein CcsA [Trueperaceae bacterium]|nr:cytochrome c biogenesis protein CcsA [Trueperaceae bacterium]